MTRTIAGGQVVNASGPAQTHKVTSGDTVYSIARKFGVSPDQLARDNSLKAPRHPAGPDAEGLLEQGRALSGGQRRHPVRGSAAGLK